MDDGASLNAAMWTMVILQSLGTIDPPGHGPRKMPPPSAYVLTVILFTILGLANDSGYGRPAKVMGWLTVLGALIFGPFGSRLIGLINSVTTLFASPTNAAVGAQPYAPVSPSSTPYPGTAPTAGTAGTAPTVRPIRPR